MAHGGEPNIFPGLHYRDSGVALDWLERAFGFARTLEVPNPDGSLAHAEARLGAGRVFLESGSRDADTWHDDRQAVYVRVDDPDAHHARAVAAGATILKPPHDTPWGRSYYVHDLDLFVWGFSTYQPS